jgi:RNA polymerase sigma-70 factor (ECF subfamily)
MAGDPLLRRAQLGDRAALDELCQREWRAVFGVVYQAVRDRQEAQDLTQEVFLRALKSLDGYEQTGAPFSAWLATIARNLVRDHWRRLQLVTVDLDSGAGYPAGGEGPEAQALLTSERRRIEQGLANLSPDHQAVIRLRILDGLPTSEVAAIMNRNPAAIRQLQHRALTALRTQLREESRP